MGGREIAAAAGEDSDDGNRLHARRRDNEPHLDWHLLGRKVCSCFRQTPKLDFM